MSALRHRKQQRFQNGFESREITSFSTKGKVPQPKSRVVKIYPSAYLVTLRQFDSFLTSYCEYTSNTAAVNIGLKLLVYTLWLLAWATDSPENTFSSSMYVLSEEFYMMTFAIRFPGILEAVEGFRTGSWADGSWEDPRIVFIAKYFMAGSMLFYYPFDHMVYLGWTVPKLVPVDAQWCFSYSCRFWVVYLIADLIVCRLKILELRRKKTVLQICGISEIKREIEKQTIECKLRYIRIQRLRSFCALLPAIKWSFDNEKEALSEEEVFVNGLMLIEAYMALYQATVFSELFED
mmetsp:Transcript_12524/g.26589  ORF Transcript_12524/g.26589 Transcript_12524/m.26589 type:complete len:293 (-) Transcript_12524:2255-3133(-)